MHRLQRDGALRRLQDLFVGFEEKGIGHSRKIVADNPMQRLLLSLSTIGSRQRGGLLHEELEQPGKLVAGVILLRREAW